MDVYTNEITGTSYSIRRANHKIELYCASPNSNPSFDLWVYSHNDMTDEWGEPVITKTPLTVATPLHECEAYLISQSELMTV